MKVQPDECPESECMGLLTACFTPADQALCAALINVSEAFEEHCCMVDTAALSCVCSQLCQRPC